MSEEEIKDTRDTVHLGVSKISAKALMMSCWTRGGNVRSLTASSDRCKCVPENHNEMCALILECQIEWGLPAVVLACSSLFFLSMI